MLYNILAIFDKNILNLRDLIELEIINDHAIGSILIMLNHGSLAKLNATCLRLEVTFGSVVIIVCLIIDWSYIVYKAVLLLLGENHAFLNFIYFNWINFLNFDYLRDLLVSIAYYTLLVLFEFIEFWLKFLNVLSY